MKHEGKMNQSKMKAGRIKESEYMECVKELTKLYSGWFAYLLKRLGEETIHIKAKDVTDAMETLVFSTSCNEDGYILTVGERFGKHDRHDRDE